jgi:hypothetical protein
MAKHGQLIRVVAIKGLDGLVGVGGALLGLLFSELLLNRAIQSFAPFQLGLTDLFDRGWLTIQAAPGMVAARMSTWTVFMLAQASRPAERSFFAIPGVCGALGKRCCPLK